MFFPKFYLLEEYIYVRSYIRFYMHLLAHTFVHVDQLTTFVLFPIIISSNFLAFADSEFIFVQYKHTCGQNKDGSAYGFQKTHLPSSSRMSPSYSLKLLCNLLFVMSLPSAQDLLSSVA
jgi:hypothetical protein